LMFKLLPGQPTVEAGKFFLNDHGTLLPVSPDGYRQALAHQARLFSGHEMFFFGCAAVFGYQIDRVRSGNLHLAAPPVPKLAGDFPSPVALSQSVVLETSYTPNQCVHELQASVDRLPAAFLWSRSKLWGTVSADGFWLQLAQGSSSQLAFAMGRFVQQGAGTRVQVELRLKRSILLFVVGTALLLPILGTVLDANSGDHRFLFLLSAMAAFGLIGNVAFALFQRRRLLSTIERALNAHRRQVS
jgi:hypothetical protein